MEAVKVFESVPEILTIKEFLSDGSLRIPDYQRPYKWTRKNVSQLFNDVAIHKNEPSYRLGTIVLHKCKDKEEEKEFKDIVDGQQRTITLALAVTAAMKELPEIRKSKALWEDLRGLEKKIAKFRFKNEQSIANIRKNYRATCSIANQIFTDEYIDFLFNKCKVVIFTLDDISEAFQFFDSQNSRGRDLDPHDILKAYHLREFSPHDEQLKASAVATWENNKAEKLSILFSNYLYRIRNWSKGKSARYFRKNDIELFKGMNLEKVAWYPYAMQLNMVHQFIEHYNRHYERNIDGSKLGFPFRLNQVIVNGRRFFEMISHYQKMVDDYNDWPHDKSTFKMMNRHSLDIWTTISSYKGCNRTGDQYVRAIFDCLIICYIDKFGFIEMPRVIEKAFIWAYRLRLSKKAVHLASIDNHVLSENLFMALGDAVTPIDFFSINLTKLEEIRFKGVEEIKTLVKEMKYYDGD